MAVGRFERVYAAVREIPPGRVLSYGQVAAAVGTTPRAVGWAMSDAPESVPWHRVVGAGGFLSIVRRSPALKALQQSLLESEGVRVDGDTVAPEFFL